jgi:hypothetical protein
MADDVKVKFGGDFTDLNKGAESAATKAGTAMQGWVSDFAKSLKSSIAQAFSLQNITSTLYSKGREQLREMAELDVLSKSLGISSTDLQQFAEMGKLAGLSQEQMGKAVQSANRLIAQAQVGNKGSQEALKQMGFTQKEVTSGQIKALDIVYKLGESFKKSGNETVTAAKATAAFGEAGSSMVTILRQGNDVIRERIRLMAIYSEEAVRAGRRANDTIERGEKIFYRETVGAAFGTLGNMAQSMEMRGLLSETKQQLGIGSGGAEVQNFNPTSSELSGMSPEQMRKFMDALLKNAAGKGINAQDVADFFKRKSEVQLGEGNREISARLASFAQLSAVEEENLKKKQLGESRFLSSATPVLAASSLQQIGGGDISSVTTGLYTGSIEDNTRRTADATEKIANKEANGSPSRASLVNKAK